MALQVRVKNKFPSQVVGSGAVTVTKSGGVWTIASDLTSYPNIDAINDLTMAANKGIYFTDADTAATFDITPAARALLDDASASAMRTTLGLAIGSDVQAFDADLSALAALAKDDGNIIVGNGTTWVVESGATARTSLGLGIGTDVQAYDADLSTIAGLAKTAGNIIYADGTTWTATAFTTVGLSASSTATLTNKTYDTAGAGNSFSINGLAATANTGTGAVVRATSATLVSPDLGAATATSLNTYVPNSAMAQPYSEGTWTPIVSTTGTVGTPAYTTQVGSYVKIGTMVYATFSLVLSGWTGSPTGAVLIGGLPVANSATANNFGAGILFFYSVAGLAASNYGIVGSVQPGQTVMALLSAGNTTTTNVSPAQAGTTPSFVGYVMYRTDS